MLTQLSGQVRCRIRHPTEPREQSEYQHSRHLEVVPEVHEPRLVVTLFSSAYGAILMGGDDSTQ